MKKSKTGTIVLCLLLALLLAGSCSNRRYSYKPASYENRIAAWSVLDGLSLPADLEEEILSLDPESVSEQDIEEVLSRAPAPRIMNIHGGIYPVYLVMESFSKFLIFMGYPEEKIRNPADGSFSYSCYESSRKLAGMIAWYYEREGMRPMMIGHSQGGIQAIKVLHRLAGTFDKRISLWSPVEEKSENRYTIFDPFSGKERPVVGVTLSFASAVGSGGITRFLPNQWKMLGRLRTIPDSVDEFTGFYMGLDFFGGDLLGYGPANKYRPNGSAAIRNVQLPATYSHVLVPMTRHLAKNRETRDWINQYIPTEKPELTEDFSSSSINILWAADTWHSIKKHWVLEVQKLIEAGRKRKQSAR